MSRENKHKKYELIESHLVDLNKNHTHSTYPNYLRNSDIGLDEFSLNSVTGISYTGCKHLLFDRSSIDDFLEV